MFTTLILSAAFVAQAKAPAPNANPLFSHRVGEEGVLHYRDLNSGKPLAFVNAWTDAAAVVRWVEVFQAESRRRERGEAPDVPGRKSAADLTEEQVGRGEVRRLADSTPVRVRALASFFETDVPMPLLPNVALVEVIGGPAKGEFVWVPLVFVGAPEGETPGAPRPDIPDRPATRDVPPPDGDKGTRDRPLAARGVAGTVADDRIASGASSASPPNPLSPRLLIEDTSWNQSGLPGVVQVHCRLRNVTDHVLEGIFMKVVYEDSAGRLVHSGLAIVGDLQPGETKTITTMDRYSDRTDHYKFEFEGRDGDRHGGIGFTTAAPKGGARRRR
jgi:hypothetical protein